MIKKIILTIVVLLLVVLVGYTFIDFRIKNSNEVPQNYIAASNGGGGEITYATYFYKDNSGKNVYKYISTTSITKSYGSSEWETKVSSKGKIKTKEDLFKVAEKESVTQVLLIKDDKTYTIEEFADILFK